MFKAWEAIDKVEKRYFIYFIMAAFFTPLFTGSYVINRDSIFEFKNFKERLNP